MDASSLIVGAARQSGRVEQGLLRGAVLGDTFAHVGDLLDELVDRGVLSVNAHESDVRHGVELAECATHVPADLFRAHLAIVVREDVTLHPVGKLLELILADLQLGACLVHAADDVVAVVRHALTAGFNDADAEFLYGNQIMSAVSGSFGPLPGESEPPPGLIEDDPVVTAPVFAIGDSVMLGAKGTVEATIPDSTVDAVVSRSYRDADSVLASHLARNPTPGVLIVHLGTNGPPTAAHFDDLMAVAKDIPRVLFVTVKLDKSWESASNAAIIQNAARFEKAELVDWHALADPHPSWFAKDVNCGCHLWNTTVRTAYAGLLLSAVVPES